MLLQVVVPGNNVVSIAQQLQASFDRYTSHASHSNQPSTPPQPMHQHTCAPPSQLTPPRFLLLSLSIISGAFEVLVQAELDAQISVTQDLTILYGSTHDAIT